MKRALAEGSGISICQEAGLHGQNIHLKTGNTNLKPNLSLLQPEEAPCCNIRGKIFNIVPDSPIKSVHIA